MVQKSLDDSVLETIGFLSVFWNSLFKTALPHLMQVVLHGTLYFLQYNPVFSLQETKCNQLIACIKVEMHNP